MGSCSPKLPQVMTLIALPLAAGCSAAYRRLMFRLLITTRNLLPLILVMLIPRMAAAYTWPGDNSPAFHRELPGESTLPLHTHLPVRVTLALPPGAGLKGFYYSEQFPSWLHVGNFQVLLNGDPATFAYESGEVGEVLPNMVPHRVILDDPDGIVDTLLPEESILVIEYEVWSNTSGEASTTENGWVGTLVEASDRAAGGWDDNAPPLLFNSTAVLIERFTIRAEPTALHLSWSVHCDGETFRLDLLRGETSDLSESQLLDSRWHESAVDCEYADGDLSVGTRYHYWLAAFDQMGDRLFVQGPLGGQIAVPSLAALNQAYPNPFNPQTTLSVDLPASSAQTRLSIFDTRGGLVRVLHEGPLDAGTHAFAWNGLDTFGKACASGLYFARFEGSGLPPSTRKLTLLR